MDIETVAVLSLATLLNLAALYLEWRDKSLKYQRIGQAMVAIEQRIVELERSRTNSAQATTKEFLRLDERITQLERQP